MGLRTSGVSRSAPVRPTVLSSLSSSCLHFLAEHADASGSGVRDGLHMRHLSQASRLLARLERGGLVHKHQDGRENHWRLTDRGQMVLTEHDSMLTVGDDFVTQPPSTTNPSKGART